MGTVFAVIDLASPIYPDIVRIFGTRRLPLVSPRLVRNSGPGVNDALFFLVDWRLLTSEQLLDYAGWMSRRFAIPADQVLEGLKDPEHGMPLLEIHVESIDPPDTVIERPRPRCDPRGPIDMRMVL